MLRNVLLAILGVTFGLFVFAISGPGSPNPDPEISSPTPYEVEAGSCYSGTVTDCDLLDIEAIWDDTSGHVSGSPVVDLLNTNSLDFDFCTDSGDVGRTFTITATDNLGNTTVIQIGVVAP